MYHTNVHAFDMMNPEEELGKEAIRKLMERFEYALEHYE